MGSLCGVNANADKKPHDIFNKLALEFPCSNNVSHCLATKRIATILIQFSQFKNDPKSLPYETIHEYINQLSIVYTNRKLLNDYIHLVTKHKTDEEYESIYNFLITEMNYKCDVITCSNIIRNQRDRSNDNNINIQQQLYDTSESKEVNTQQLCDKIHCYFLHTFDLGYRLTENERQKVKISDEKIAVTDTDNTDDVFLTNCIDNELLRCQEIVHHKQERLASIDISQSKQQSVSISSYNSKNSTRNSTSLSNPNRKQNNKWILNRNEYTARRSFRTLNDDPNNYKKEEIYSYGFRFRYGKYHKNNEWFIPFKYEHLKSELTQNNINQLSIDQFNGWFDNALDHFESDHCKSMAPYIDKSSISVNHLLSIIIYCGADELQRSLTQTYRKLKSNEYTESNKDLINRHSEYAHWGELLFKTANNFGIEVKQGAHEKFYHGIDHEMTFESTIAYFHAPLSTSSEYEVALVFANQTGNHGLIIELQNLDESHVAYFDCQWCSEFAYENEKFFIGGDFGLIIRNIIAPISAQNYEIYIEGLNIIQQMMRGNQYKYKKGQSIPKHVKKCVKKLLKHELYEQSKEISKNNYTKYKNLPTYIEKSLHYYCVNVMEIDIDWRTLHQKNENKESKGYRFTKDIFVSNECNSSFVDLNSLCLLFPNMHKITVSNLKLNRSAMESLSTYFQQFHEKNDNNDEKNDDNNTSKLTEIVIYRPIKDIGFDDVSAFKNDMENDVNDDTKEGKLSIKNSKNSRHISTITVAINEYSHVFLKYGWALEKKARFEMEITKLQ